MVLAAIQWEVGLATQPGVVGVGISRSIAQRSIRSAGHGRVEFGLDEVGLFQHI
jgi:hypothetical protein